MQLQPRLYFFRALSPVRPRELLYVCEVVPELGGGPKRGWVLVNGELRYKTARLLLHPRHSLTFYVGLPQGPSTTPYLAERF